MKNVEQKKLDVFGVIGAIGLGFFGMLIVSVFVLLFNKGLSVSNPYTLILLWVYMLLLVVATVYRKIKKLSFKPIYQCLVPFWIGFVLIILNLGVAEEIKNTMAVVGQGGQKLIEKPSGFSSIDFSEIKKQLWNAAYYLGIALIVAGIVQIAMTCFDKNKGEIK